jgi:ABC-type branched-subunit amino acid transport system permease subunit
MTRILEIVMLGLAPGALIAGIALGIVLTYRGTGAVNIATGGIAVVGAYVFFTLKTSGYLLFPIFKLGGPWSIVPAVVVSLTVCALVGVLIELLVWRPLRHAAPLAKLVASLGVLIVIQSVVTLQFGGNGQAAPAVFPGLEATSVHLFGAVFPADELALFAIVVVAAFALAAAYRYTRFGLATRAAQESEVHGVLAGLSPQRLSLANTVLAALVAGGVGMLAADQTSLDPTTIPLAVIPALGAALLANFTSFTGAMAAGVGLGVLDYLIVNYFQTLSWFPTDLAGQPLPGVPDLVFFLVIVAAMLWRGARLPQRGAVFERRLPRAPSPKRLARPALGSFVVLVVAFLVLPYDFRQSLTNSLIGVIICLSLVVITGFVGQISLLQVALAGVSGFFISKLAVHAGIGFPVGLIIGTLAAMAFGLLSALPALRVRGVNLAIVTLAGAQALYEFGFSNARWGGGLSALNVPEPHLLGLNLGTTASFPINSGVPSPVFGFVCAAFAVTCCVLVGSVRRSGFGQRMLAVRSNERAAAASGISVRNVKLAAFALSSALAGVAGGLYAYNFSSVSADRFDIVLALTFIAFAYVGGITSVRGGVLGGLGVTSGILSLVLQNGLGIPVDYQLLVGGVALVMIVVTQPAGLAAAEPPWVALPRLLQRLRSRSPRAADAAAAGVGK